MTFDVLHTLVDYHYWARDRMFPVVEALTDVSYGDRSATASRRSSTRSCISSARIGFGTDDGRACRRCRCPHLTCPTLGQVRASVGGRRTPYPRDRERARTQGIARPIGTRGWDRRRQAQPFWQMLQHLVNHGSYHRGSGYDDAAAVERPTAGAIDLITFYRERANVTA